jgi:GTPase
MITFFDVAGHQRYFRTIIKGVSSYCPDYLCIVVDAKAGQKQTGLDHINIALSYDTPIFVVFTKIDLATHDELIQSEQVVRELIKKKDNY